MQSVTRARLLIGLVFLAALRTSAGPTQDRITILYDGFGKPSGMKKDWGYSALVEYRRQAYPFRYWQQCGDLRSER